MTTWSSTIMMVIGRSVMMRSSERDANADDSIILFVYKHLCISSQQSRPFGNRMRPKCLYAFMTTFLLRIRTRPAILDLQQQRTVLTRYLNPRVATKGMTPHIAQSFRDDLKDFRRQTIVDLHFATRFDVDFYSGHN